MSFKVTFSPPPTFEASFSAEESFEASFGTYVVVPEVDYFDGDYEITPSAEVQTIPIIGKTARRNITIDSIPHNYGLITQVGAGIRVS